MGIGGTVQNLLDAMSVIDNELDTVNADRARAIQALTLAQHYFESLAASMPRVLSTGAIANNVIAGNGAERTSWTSSLRRLDAIWYLDSNGFPVRKIKRIDDIGGHVPDLPWPVQMSIGTGIGGAPFEYYADMAAFYWLPRPELGTAYTMRVYGFFKQPEFVDSTSDFNYPLECKLPIAQFAGRMLTMSVGDDTIEYDKLAAQLFRPILRSLRKFDRSKPMSRYYSEFHST